MMNNIREIERGNKIESGKGWWTEKKWISETYRIQDERQKNYGWGWRTEDVRKTWWWDRASVMLRKAGRTFHPRVPTRTLPTTVLYSVVPSQLIHILRGPTNTKYIIIIFILYQYVCWRRLFGNTLCVCVIEYFTTNVYLQKVLFCVGVFIMDHWYYHY